MRAPRHTPEVFRIFRPIKLGQPPLMHIRLSGGMLMCRIDDALHRKALANAARTLNERQTP